MPDYTAAAGRLTIDLGAIARNYQTLAARIAPARTGAVVKADAYGLGAREVAPALAAAGCGDFFVAQFAEALALRPLLAADLNLYVLNGLQPGSEDACAAAAVTPVLNSLEQVDRWAAAARRARRSLPALLQFDTGMSRLGLSASEAATLAAAPGRLKGVDLRYVMSHLASADDPANPQNASQLAVMQAIAATWPGLGVSFANSGGVFLGASYHGDLARPGIVLYGGSPTTAASPMEPAVQLHVPVIQVRVVPATTRIGYGGAHITSAETRMATLAAGYADGLLRSLSNRGAGYYNGIRLPVAGRVSMDSVTLDITALPAATLRLGSLIEFIGPNQSLEALAADAGTIGWEILTSLGQRFQRLYR